MEDLLQLPSGDTEGAHYLKDTNKVDYSLFFWHQKLRLIFQLFFYLDFILNIPQNCVFLYFWPSSWSQPVHYLSYRLMVTASICTKTEVMWINCEVEMKDCIGA